MNARGSPNSVTRPYSLGLTIPSRPLVAVVLGAGLGALSAAVLGIGVFGDVHLLGARSPCDGLVERHTGTDRVSEVTNDVLAGVVAGVA